MSTDSRNQIGPEVSVVVGVHNEQERLRETLENLLGQEDVDLEVVVVNDGSSDSTGRILADYASRDSRLVFVHQERKGLTCALIRGCERARGVYIGRQDVGDLSRPDRLRKQREWLAARPDAVMVSCGVRTVGPGGEYLHDMVPDESDATRWLRADSVEGLKGPGAHGSVVFRRSAYERVGGYRSEFYFAQDLDLWVRLVEIGRHTVVPEILLQTEVEVDSISGTQRREQIALRRLVVESARRRRAGLDESSILAHARGIRPARRSGMKDRARRAATLYFIGSCLARRDDVAAVKYLGRAVCANPLHLKAWYRWLVSRAVSSRKSSPRGVAENLSAACEGVSGDKVSSSVAPHEHAAQMDVSVVIPTYRREGVLLDTIAHLTRQCPSAAEILVIDQTLHHRPETERWLSALHGQARIRWIRLSRPSIPAAMNRGLLEAIGTIVLFLDDDIVPCEGLIDAHERAHRETGAAIVAGRVIQPWDDEVTFSGERRWASDFMAGNVSMRRDVAMATGGFDENFVHVAYRFEREFAERACASGERILFEPAARIRHLKMPDGGTRSYGDHLRTVRPSHAVGEYYYLLGRRSGSRLLPVLSRPLRAVTTGHHLRRPWWIPVTLTAEVLGFGWALRLRMRGPRLLGGGNAR